MSAAKTKHVPALRFPEFGEPWITDSVDSFVKRVNNPVKVEPDCMYRQIGVRSHGKGIFHKEPVTGKSLGEKRVFWVHPKAFVVNIVFGWEQAVALTSAAENGFIASHRFPMFIPVENKTDLNFLLLFFLRKKGKYLLGLASPGGAGRNKTLGQNEFAKLDMTLPPLIEQQKIVAFVGSIDKKLEALRHEHELLNTYKRGLVQKMFSLELHFQTNDAVPDWKEIRLGEIIKIKYGKDHKELADGKIPVYGTGGIMRHVDKALSKGPSVLIGRKGTINRPIFVTEPFWTVDTLFYSEIYEGYVPYFVFQLVKQINWLKYNEATGVPSLNTSSINDVKVKIPIKREEQQKIADFLSTIDAKIDAVAVQIEKMKQFKKGLLQQMFV